MEQNSEPGSTVTKEIRELKFTDFISSNWFHEIAKGSIWISAYRMQRANPTDFQNGSIVIDLDTVRAVMLYGKLNYVDSSSLKPEFRADGFRLTGAALTNQETPEGAYLVLIVPFDVDGAKGNESKTRDKLKATVGLLGALNGRNVVFEHVFETEVALDARSTSSISPIFENPFWFPPVDTAPANITFLSDAGAALAKLQETERNRLELSLRWFEGALYDRGVDAFLKHWFAIETIGMPGTTDIKPINEALRTVYNLTYPEVVKRFQVGRIYGFRSRIVHDGHIVPMHAQLGRYMEALYVDLLLAQLGMKSEHRLEKVFSQPDFKLDDYLR